MVKVGDTELKGFIAELDMKGQFSAAAIMSGPLGLYSFTRFLETQGEIALAMGCFIMEVVQYKRSLSEATDDEGASQAGCDAPEPPPAVAVEDDASSQSDKGDAAAEDKGMLFELANIHATIIKLEQRAGQVEPLEARVADLEAEVARLRGA